MLVLDGCIQVTERDEFAYQEMIAHIPLFANKNPKSVLIIGGGDGGVLREVLKHSSVETVYMVEIDRMVVEVSKEYLKDSTATSFADPRVKLLFEDAAVFVRTLPSDMHFDTIICDSSDPVGPAASLFTTEFYQDLYRALAPGRPSCLSGYIGVCAILHTYSPSILLSRVHILSSYCVFIVLILFVSSQEAPCQPKASASGSTWTSFAMYLTLAEELFQW